jgi:hypothetical protein
MFRISRRRVDATVQFCDSCAEVTTAADRAHRRLDRIRTEVYATIAHIR